jgi:hypothetical protein
MSRMGSAQKLSVDQLKQAVQDGTLPAYVGIPLIQDKLKQQQEAQAGKPVPPQPPVADQILQAANQRRGIDEAQSNLPEMTAAEGGIMSYADGGDVDSEDYEDQKQEESDAQDLAYAQMMSDASENQGNAKEPAYVNQTPKVEFGIKPPTGGVDALLSHIVRKESGGRDYDAKGNPLTSNKGAKFAMQVLDSTAKDPGFGIKPAKDVSATEYNRVGKELATALLGKYQDPKLAAIAYNWGAGNTDKWLASGANPTKLPKETQAYIVGANFADGGIVALAAGGAVPSYAQGDFIDPATYDASSMADDQSMAGIANPALQRSYDVVNGIKSLGSNIGTALTTPRNYDPITKLLIDPARAVQRWGQTPLPQQADMFRSASMNPDQPASLGYTIPAGSNRSVVTNNNIPASSNTASTPASSATTVPPSMEQMGPTDADYIRQLKMDMAAKPEATEQKPESEMDRYLKDIREQREGLKSQKEEDKYLALMAAGLGTLKASGTVEPGKVHTALGDIATGGMEGVSYLTALNKQRAAEQAALNKELGLGMYRQQITQATAGNKSAQLDINRAALEEKKREFAGKQLEGKDKQIRDQVLAGYKIDSTKALSDPDVAASIEKQIAQAKQNDPTYNLLHKNYYGFDYSTPVKTNTVSFNDLK